MNHYVLDPAWYFSTRRRACAATLIIRKVQPELLIGPDMLLMIESDIRGGILTNHTATLKPTRIYRN